MKRIYLFMFMSAWMFAACSSTGESVKSDASAMETPQEVQATAPAAETQPKVAANSESDEVFHHSGAGFSLTKPGNWNYLSPEMVQAAGQSVKMEDKELEKMIKENPNSPLVVITRYQEPYPTLNPSVAVTMVHMPIEGMAPKDVLNMSTQVLKRAYPDLTYVDEVQDANVDGINGAYTKVKYTMAAGDQKFPTMTRMWLVPRGKVMFTVGMSGPQDGPDVSEDSFDEILKSIKIQK
ncbi:MAG: hypothetical protein OEZ51_06085 [Nitrospinota bacterium]|nr:hypothetical protein [Nitrospinota bacterium]